MGVRAFVVTVGTLLVVCGGVSLVLDQLRVLERCATVWAGIYGIQESCTQSPILLIFGLVASAVGLIAAVGAVAIR